LKVPILPRPKDRVVHHNAIHVNILIRRQNRLLDLSLFRRPFLRTLRDDANLAELVFDSDGFASLRGPARVGARGRGRVGEDADEFRLDGEGRDGGGKVCAEGLRDSFTYEEEQRLGEREQGGER
jgi:hypothetical protein